MSVLSKEYFHNEAAAFEHVESVLWPKGPVCPHCGNADRIYKLEGVRTKPTKKSPYGVERHGLKKCGACRKQFTVRIGTIFEESHIPLHKWLQAIHLICSSKKGISANQLHRVLEVTLKSAWFLGHRIREAMRSGEFEPMGGRGKIVEADETYFGKQENPQMSAQRKIDAETALERIRWHAESGASAYETMAMSSAYVCARVRLQSILKVFDQFDGSDEVTSFNRVGVECPIGEKLVIGDNDLRQRRDFKFLYLELSEALPVAVNDNRVQERLA